MGNQESTSEKVARIGVEFIMGCVNGNRLANGQLPIFRGGSSSVSAGSTVGGFLGTHIGNAINERAEQNRIMTQINNDMRSLTTRQRELLVGLLGILSVKGVEMNNTLTVQLIYAVKAEVFELNAEEEYAVRQIGIQIDFKFD